METNYNKLAGAIALGILAASAVKTVTTTTTATIGLWWAKRKLKKELEAIKD